MWDRGSTTNENADDWLRDHDPDSPHAHGYWLGDRPPGYNLTTEPFGGQPYSIGTSVSRGGRADFWAGPSPQGSYRWGGHGHLTQVWTLGPTNGRGWIDMRGFCSRSRMTVDMERRAIRAPRDLHLQSFLRHEGVRVCDWCRAAYTAQRSTSRYCSDACRAKARRATAKALGLCGGADTTPRSPAPPSSSRSVSSKADVTARERATSDASGSAARWSTPISVSKERKSRGYHSAAPPGPTLEVLQ